MTTLELKTKVEANSEVLFDNLDNCLSSVLLAFRGSISHGLYIPDNDPNSTDDIDLISIHIPLLENYMGLKTWGSRGTKQVFYNEFDIVAYEFLKFIRMLAQGNPNVFTMLWLNPEFIIYDSDIWKRILEDIDLFVGKHVFAGFNGYAKAEFDKITKMSGEIGAKRKQLIEKYGYNTRNASHVIRLMRLAIEFLNTGNMTTDRRLAGDVEELLGIKTGKIKLDEVVKLRDSLDKELIKAYDNSKLKDTSDFNAISSLCQELVFEHFLNE
jgi:predicted nucleotidyltransferase